MIDLTALILVIIVGLAAAIAAFPVSRWVLKNFASGQPTPRRVVSEGTPRKRYFALRLIAGMMGFLGWIMLLAGVILIVIESRGISSLVSSQLGQVAHENQVAFNVMFALIGMIFGPSLVAIGLFLIAFGQTILLFVDVERNTRATEFYTRQTRDSMATLLQGVARTRSPANVPPTQTAVSPSGNRV